MPKKTPIYNPPTPLGKFLYAEMLNRGIKTVRQFQHYLGVSSITILDLFKVEREADLNTLLILSARLNVSLLTLIYLARPDHAGEIADQLEHHAPAVLQASIRRLQYTDPDLVNTIARTDQLLIAPSQQESPEALASEINELRELTTAIQGRLDLLAAGYPNVPKPDGEQAELIRETREDSARIIDLAERRLHREKRTTDRAANS